jgi:hypothetical protein
MIFPDGWEPETPTAAQPAAGASVTVAMPGAVRWYLQAVCFRLVADANVAARTPIVTVLDGTGVARARVAAGFSTSAGTTVDYTFAHGLAEWDSGGTTIASGPGPVLFMQDGDSIVISVDGVQAGDQLSRVRVTVLQKAVRAD